jgi:hypothetical protein
VASAALQRDNKPVPHGKRGPMIQITLYKWWRVARRTKDLSRFAGERLSTSDLTLRARPP